jgi:SH3 domain-containing YSC84-like protein 1
MNRNRFVALFGLILACVTLATGARAQNEQAQIIAESRLVVASFQNEGNYVADVRRLVHNARAVVIIPNLVKGGFIFGAQGGTGILVAHLPDGSWSYPAFYNMGAASFGLQIGVSVSRIVLVINSERALKAVLQNEFKIGAEAGLAIATLGAGAEASTTAAAGADIVAMANSKGLFGGIAIQGGIMRPYDSWNALFYGEPVSAADIVLNGKAANPLANRLRAALAAE